MKRIATLTSLFLMMLAAAAWSQEPQWPRFHGSQVTNRSTETGLLKSWPNGGPELIYKVNGLGQGYANVIIKDQRLYTAGTVDRQTVVMAYDMNGKQLWKTPNMDSPTAKIPPQNRQIEYYFGVKATPTLDGSTVYHINMFGRLTALDAASGKEQWHLDLAKKFEGAPSFFGYSESVLIDGNKLFVQPGGKKGYIVALNKKNGQVIWANTAITDSVASYATPVLATIAGKRQLVTMTPTAAVGLDPNDGKLLWSFPHINRDKENIETPVVFDDHVAVSSCYGQQMDCHKISKTGSSWKTEQVWSNSKADNLHGGLIYHNGHLYGVACRGGRWFCLDAKTGVETYRDRGVGLGELTYADGMLYCLGHNGSLMLVPADPAGFNPVGSITHADDGQAKWYTHPVVCGGRLYIRHGDWLYVYNITKA